MPELLPQQPTGFAGFGGSLLTTAALGSTQQDSVDGWEIPDDRIAARLLLRERCPLTPGVYGWLDRNNQLCYVGKSKALRKRLLSYFAKTPSDPKMGRIVRHSQRLVWEPVSHELLALIREQELINRWRPDFNKQGQPHRRQPAYICIGGSTAPRAYVALHLTQRSQWAIGPIAGTSRLKAAVEAINLTFGLRDCPDRTKFQFSNQRQLFDNVSAAGCIRFELGSCPGPCAGRCSKEKYLNQVANAIDFLRLKDVSALIQLEQQMLDAGARQHFEKATLLRDRWKHLSWLALRMSALEESREKLNGVVPVDGFGRRAIWLVLKSGQMVGSLPQPRTVKQAAMAKQNLMKLANEIVTPPANVMEMNLQLMIAAWYRKDPAFRKNLMSLDDTLAFCESKHQPANV